MKVHQDKKEVLDLTVLYEITKTIKDSLEPRLMLQSIYQILEKFLNAEDLALWMLNIEDKEFKRIFCSRNIINPELLTEININLYREDLQKEEYIALIYSNKKIFAVKKNEEIPPDASAEHIILILPLFEKANITGIISLAISSTMANTVLMDIIMVFTIIATQISIAIMHDKFRNQIESNAIISCATKDVAKIIESQYELDYVIPLMGEIMDKYIPNALVYLFLRDKTDNFNLTWPASYSVGSIDPVLEKMKKTFAPVISESKKIIAIPILFKDELFGALVADGKTQDLTDKEIIFLKELIKQCSITLNRAIVYAETVKHATIDALTGLDNRRQLDKRLMQEASVVIRTGRALSLLMIDVDYFKLINDTHGHSVGDHVLRELAKIIRSTIREYDIAGRYGGEEFAVILPDTKLEGAKKLAERLRISVEKARINIGKYATSKTDTIKITVSAGLTEFDASCKNPADIYEEADIALYRAKQDGRNKVVLFNE